MQTYSRGVIYVVLAGVFLSTGGIIVRLIENADAWLVLFYRSLAFFLTVLVYMLLRDGTAITHRFCQMRRTDFIVSVSLASGFIFYVLSLYNTTVSNTVLLLSTGPFFAALLGWVVLRESVSRITWLTMLLALAGVVVMVSGELASSDIYGMVYAVAAILAFAVMIVTLRQAGQRDMLAATALAGLVAALFTIPFIEGFGISGWDFFMAVCTGSLQVGLGFILITLASKSVPAAQVPLLALGETALAPLWVWIFVAEVPQSRTLVGGVLVLTAVVCQGWAGIRAAKKSTDLGYREELKGGD